MKRSFVFDGESSESHRITVKDSDTLGGAEADLEEYKVLGKDGSVFVSRERRNNIIISYSTRLKVPTEEDMPSFTGDLKRWLMSQPGKYRRLEDGNDPDHYRKAVCITKVIPERKLTLYADQEISFSCKPYRYRKAGEAEVNIPLTASGLTLMNDTGFDALPQITLVFGGSSSDATATVQVSGESGYTYSRVLIFDRTLTKLTMDSDEMEIIIPAGSFAEYSKLDLYPVLPPGVDVIKVTGGRVQSAGIRPMWREL